MNGVHNETREKKGRNDTRRRIGELFKRLMQIMATLRGPKGCPWDKAQTHESIKRNTIEEAYEVVNAIEEGNDEKLKEELGDLLLQVIFHSQIASEAGRFDIADVVGNLIEKLIARHPHVFGENRQVKTPEQALAQWENIKAKEHQKLGSLMDGLTWTLPSLMLAHHAQKRAAQVGFDWNDPIPALQKLKEEVSEVERVLENELKNKEKIEDEIGDLLFAAVNVARLAGIDAEMALRRAVRKFVIRFKAIEEIARQQGKSLDEMSLEEMDAIWEAIKLRSH